MRKTLIGALAIVTAAVAWLGFQSAAGAPSELAPQPMTSSAVPGAAPLVHDATAPAAHDGSDTTSHPSREKIETEPFANTISGVLLDEQGAPVSGASVTCRGAHAFAQETATTGPDGGFRIERSEGDPPGPLHLWFDHDRYDRTVSDLPYPWGAANLEFVTKRGRRVQIIVTDADTGTPIEDFGIRCFPAPDSERATASHRYRTRHRGRHAAGKFAIENITRGSWILVVEPEYDDWQTSGLIRFEVTDRGAPLQVVELARTATRLLRVRRPDGEPVARTKVQLVRPTGRRPVTLQTRVTRLEALMNNPGSDWAVTLVSERTNARGEVELYGPPDDELTLRVLGPGHQPIVHHRVSLGRGAEPLTVVVPDGATVRGAVRPTLPALREAGVFLLRENAGRRETVPANGAAVQLDENGEFEIRGVPPGSWGLLLSYQYAIDLDARSRGAGSGSVVPGQEFLRSVLDLRDGDAREVLVDIHHLAPGRVTGKILRGGRPVQSAMVHLIGRKPDGRGGEQFVMGPVLTLDQSGAFSARLMPATYRPHVIALRTSGTNVPVDEAITIAAGQAVDRVFHLRTGALRVRVVRHDGQPIAGVQVHVADPEKPWSTPTPATDEHGWTALDVVPVGQLQLTAVPKRRLDDRVRGVYHDAYRLGGSATLPEMVELGTVRVAERSEPTVIEVTMPASSGY